MKLFLLITVILTGELAHAGSIKSCKGNMVEATVDSFGSTTLMPLDKNCDVLKHSLSKNKVNAKSCRDLAEAQDYDCFTIQPYQDVWPTGGVYQDRACIACVE